MRVVFLFALIAFIGCTKSTENRLIYSSPRYSVYSNKVIQGANSASVLSPTKIVSTFHTGAFKAYSRRIEFKFSINEMDLELPAYTNHILVIGDEHESPIIQYGRQFKSQAPDSIGFLPPNYSYTFRVDMSSVLDELSKSGSYTASNGSVISKADFKGFYICGSGFPLTWDFSNLDEKGMKLTPTGEGNIYSFTTILNPVSASDTGDKTWRLNKDISSKPHFVSNIPLVDALYNMSVEEALTNIEPDSTFRTGAKWGGVWTRDVSYSIFLAFAYHQPDIAMNCLRRKVKRDRIIQDTGSGGAWPVSSDRVVWALAAHEIYLVTGDKDWLAYSYNVVKNSVEDDKMVVFDASTGLYRGESSFLDWREQTYPKWMQNADIYSSENLGTNVLHYLSLKVCGDMAKELNQSFQGYYDQAELVKSAINSNLWMEDKGFYSQYLYGRDALTQSPRFEALGEALSVYFDVASSKQSQQIYQKSPLTAFGATCIYPQIPGIPPYHNNAIWPFVQSYWNLGAAKAKNESALTHGLAAIYRAGALFLTNYENMVADNGDYFGTEINSDHMLWSMAGNIAMIHRVFLGMHFENDGVFFQPVVPESFGGFKELANFKYRGAVLDVKVNGFGANVASFKLDGKKCDKPFVEANLVGNHTVEIELDNQSFSKDGINLVNNEFSLPTPQSVLSNGTLVWNSLGGAVSYKVYYNGKAIDTIKDTTFIISRSGEFKVSAIDKYGWESFTSEPIRYFKDNEMTYIDFDQSKSTEFAADINNYFGNGFVELSLVKNLEFIFNLNVVKSADYLVDFRYANGSGAWNTDNSCAIRTLYVNGDKCGSVVMPQRGTNEWSNWGYSNSVKIHLNKGSNKLKLAFMPWDNNMNYIVNRALIDQLRVYAAY